MVEALPMAEVVTEVGVRPFPVVPQKRPTATTSVCGVRVELLEHEALDIRKS